MTLGGKKRVKDLVRLLRWKSDAGIADRDQQLTVLAALRLDPDFVCPIHILHRVNAVHHEVHEHLLQLHAISYDAGQVCSELRTSTAN
jgi:hypothetical protein